MLPCKLEGIQIYKLLNLKVRLLLQSSSTECCYGPHAQFLSADSHSSTLLVRPSKEEEGRKEGSKEGLFSNSLVEMEELKVWVAMA